MSIRAERFNDAAAFVHAVSTREVNNGWKGERRSSRKRDDWGGVSSWEEAMDKAQGGYPEIVDRTIKAMDKSVKKVFERVDLQPVRPINGYVGGSPNVTRAMQGLPRDMRTMRRQDRKKPGITLIYEGSANWRITDEQLISAGARMLALVRLFERAQVPVRLVAAITTEDWEGRDKYVTAEVTVKDFSNALNVQKVAYYLAHPSFLRRLFFSWVETTPIIRRHNGGYGYPITNYESDCRSYGEEVYRERGAHWFSFRDFESDEDVVRAYNKINERK